MPAVTPAPVAMKWRLPDGGETVLVAHSFNGVPAATAEECRELLIAIGTSGPEPASLTSLEMFLRSHLLAKAFLEGHAPAVSHAAH
jgi:catalase